jgi:hypothetical protein
VPKVSNMSLAWNTRRLMDTSTDRPTGQPVEYHLLSGRALYDAATISHDPLRSGTAEWILHADQDFYSVSVVSRPFDALPQELCVSFPCFVKRTEGKVASSVIIPLDDVAFEFAALLSLLAREPITLLGLRRLANRPITNQYPYIPPPQDVRRLPRPPSPIDSRELRAILEGIGRSTDDETIDAALAAAKLYYAGLSIARFDPSGAYVSLVSAIECLAGHHYKARKFLFDQTPKFEGLRPILDKLSTLPGAQNLVEQCKNELMKQEHLIKSKFRLLIAEFIPEDFLLTTDQLYQIPAVGAPRDKAASQKASAMLTTPGHNMFTRESGSLPTLSSGYTRMLLSKRLWRSLKGYLVRTGRSFRLSFGLNGSRIW